MTEKLTPISRALVAASKMPAHESRRILMMICQAGMTLDKPTVQEPTEGEKHFAKREKFIRRMDATCKRVIKYAKHETLRKIEKHFRASDAISSADSGGARPTPETPSLAARLTFDKGALSEELLAALAEEQTLALGIAGQQLFDEIGKDSVWRIPSQDAIQFVQNRANLLANVPDEIHREIMTSIEQGLQHGESRKELMARISTAFDEIGKSRSETIANTETAAAFNYSRDKAMREAGVTHKRWLHSMSPLIKEPRPTHLEADGQTVPIDDPFDVGGVQFMRPADDSLGAGAEDIINCHCVAIPVESPASVVSKELLALECTFDPSQPRDEQGRWVHEMTRDQFRDNPITVKVGRRKAYYSPIGGFEAQGINEEIDLTHKRAVYKAFKEGKEIPLHVAKDYPEVMSRLEKKLPKEKLHSFYKGEAESARARAITLRQKFNDPGEGVAPIYMKVTRAEKTAKDLEAKVKEFGN